MIHKLIGKIPLEGKAYARTYGRACDEHLRQAVKALTDRGFNVETRVSPSTCDICEQRPGNITGIMHKFRVIDEARGIVEVID